MGDHKKIYSERCWVEGRLQPATICIQDEKISAVLYEKSDDATDMGNAIIMPGVIDAHVHVNEPGRTDWEGFDTATQAAAAGGTTTIIDMPLNASPVTTSAKAFDEKLQASAGKLHVNVGFYGGLVPGNIDELETLMDAGVLGIKCFLTHSGIDEFPNVGEKELEEAMPLIAKHNLPLLVHCEIDEPGTDTALNAAPAVYENYLASRPKKWENAAIEKMIGLCGKHRCKTHIVHVSSAEALTLIHAAKKEALPLTAETCPQYIFFDAQQIKDGETLFKCAPPIRDRENNELLKKALADNTLDFIATDHSPAPASLKEIESGNFKKAWGGIAGLQFLLSSAYTALKHEIKVEQIIPLLTEHPAKFLGIENRKGFFKPGYDADIVIWQPEEMFVPITSDVLYRHKLTPYVGRELFGVIKETIVNGISVYKNNHIIHKNAGQWLLKK